MYICNYSHPLLFLICPEMYSLQFYVIKLSLTSGRLVVFSGTPVSSADKNDSQEIVHAVSAIVFK